jgi:6-pyruvoyltetrahydropterin/6-carboxytetrahydropterin synthase
MMRVTRRYRFSASHRLHNAALTDEQNRAIYGKCNNPYGHGHNYVLAVSAAGSIEEKSGRVVDTRILDRLVEEEVIRPFDHKNLNTQIPEFVDGTVVPTSESLAEAIRDRLARAWPRAFPAGRPGFERVRLEETRKNKFELAVPLDPGKGERSEFCAPVNAHEK